MLALASSAGTGLPSGRFSGFASGKNGDVNGASPVASVGGSVARVGADGVSAAVADALAMSIGSGHADGVGSGVSTDDCTGGTLDIGAGSFCWAALAATTSLPG